MFFPGCVAIVDALRPRAHAESGQYALHNSGGKIHRTSTVEWLNHEEVLLDVKILPNSKRGASRHSVDTCTKDFTRECPSPKQGAQRRVFHISVTPCSCERLNCFHVDLPTRKVLTRAGGRRRGSERRREVHARLTCVLVATWLHAMRSSQLKQLANGSD